MKRCIGPLVAAALLFLTQSAVGQATGDSAKEVEKKPPAAAQSVIDAAVKKAKTGNKSVLIHFSASW